MGYLRTGKNTFIQKSVSMIYKGIIIRGTSGTGKSTIAGQLCKKHGIFQLIQAVTTHEWRIDDKPDRYHYVAEE